MDRREGKTKPLSGFRIVELGHTEASGIAGQLLCDYGAEVILPDDPSAADERGLSSSGHYEPGSCSHLWDRGKKRVFLDPRDKGDARKLLSLLASADVLLDGRTVQERRYAWPDLNAKWLQTQVPGIAYVAVTPFGLTGPYADHLADESAVQAESGFVSTTGPEGGEPVRSGGDVASFLGGLIDCITVLMMLAERAKKDREGRPAIARMADVSMMDSILFGLENQFSLYLKSGMIPRPHGNRYALSAPVGNFLCGDGREIMISVATETQWQAFAEAVGHPEWVEDDRYLNVSRRLKNVQELGEDVTKAFSAFTREELMERLQSRACIYGCINDFKEATGHPQVAARQMFASYIDEAGHAYTAPANPLQIDGRHMQETRIHQPGEDTEEILGK